MPYQPTDILPHQPAADTALVVEAPYVAQYTAGFEPADTAQEVVAPSVTTRAVMEVPAGKPALKHADTPVNSSGTVALVLMVMFLVFSGYHKGYKYLANMAHNLLSAGSHQNFLNELTADENQIITILTINTCLTEALLMCGAIQCFVPSLGVYDHIFSAVLILTGVTVLFYLLQWVTYKVLGFVFAEKPDAEALISGFKASQSLIGIFYLPLVLVMLINPGVIKGVIYTALGVYVLVRAIFIYKGLRIFFTNFSSIFLFILYLCSAEIIPPILLYRLSISSLEFY